MARDRSASRQACPPTSWSWAPTGAPGFEHLLLGSVAEKVLRRAPCPVLTVGLGAQPPRPAGSFKRILCATDLSEASAATIALALSLAGEQQSELTVLHVLEGLQLYENAPEVGSLRRRLEDGARRSSRPPSRRRCASGAPSASW